jgi:hypothetical protein
MGGNTFGNPSDDIQYALRITFGIVHGVMLTLFSFGLALFFPSLSQLLFVLFGCVVIPIMSLLLTIFCNACIEYVSQSTLTVARVLKTAWIPPLGVFCVNLIILPLEMMPALGFTGPINTLLITSILKNFALTTILQIYAARDIQRSTSYSSKSSGTSVPT